jgi:hypothetical protein
LRDPQLLPALPNQLADLLRGICHYFHPIIPVRE